MIRLSAILLSALMASAMQAQDQPPPFVEANLLGIFYHELGHALIDIEGLPVFGQEEDAADVFSILVIDALYEEDSALDLAYSVADGFWGEALAREAEELDIAWWDVHGADEQRFYNTVCLFYGADPDQRDDFAQDMGLPEERADTCGEEFELAYDSWGPVLETMADRKDGAQIAFNSFEDSLTSGLIYSEVKALNSEFRLAAPLTVTVEPCGEANAFYDPETVEIIMCSEFAAHLTELADLLAE